MGIERQLEALEALAERSRRVLEDSKKAKWHQDARSQLAQIEAEQERLRAREVSRSKEQVEQVPPH